MLLQPATTRAAACTQDAQQEPENCPGNGSMHDVASLNGEIAHLKDVSACYWLYKWCLHPGS